jgi:hypothetical protein
VHRVEHRVLVVGADVVDTVERQRARGASAGLVQGCYEAGAPATLQLRRAAARGVLGGPRVARRRRGSVRARGGDGYRRTAGVEPIVERARGGAREVVLATDTSKKNWRLVRAFLGGGRRRERRVTRAVLGTGAVTGSLGHAAVCGVGGYTRRRAQHRVRQEGVRRWWIGKSQNNILPKARPRGDTGAESPNLDSHWPKRLGRVSEAGTLNLTLHTQRRGSAPSPTCVRRPPAARCPRWR